ncbi:MAG: ABC transporter substrate-binding protein [Crocinitomicaceae bacterium]|nr:helical backbone metal receptor [Flavobacteriales bacterium]NQZ37860.1 ABC transporter substrate-binding protein [Crocinitomicaceae bacterium]
MKTVTDQMNQTIRLESTPRRIVSLVPSQTEFLHYLGLEDEVVGITKFCIHPNEWFQEKPRVGGTKGVDLEKVLVLNPDLIIGNKEENTQEDIEMLKSVAPVWMSDIYDLPDAILMLRELGLILDKAEKVDGLIKEILDEFSSLHEFCSNHPVNGKTVLYFIWNEPGFLAGKNTFIDSMLTECGMINVAKGDRYPEVDLSTQPDFIFLSSEPFPFEEKHIASFQKRYPKSKIVLVDGEMFSWYGSRLKDAPRYFQDLLQGLIE